jgi:hypothetical protein
MTLSAARRRRAEAIEHCRFTMIQGLAGGALGDRTPVR